RHGAEHAQGPAAAVEQAGPGLLAEGDGPDVVHREEPSGELGVRLEAFLSAEYARRDHHGVEPAQYRVGGVEGLPEAFRSLEIARSVTDRAATSAPHLEIRRAARELLRIPAEQEQVVAPLRHEAGERAAHPLGGAQQDDLHGRSPSSRTD